jgi:hypothetical protein
MRITAFICLLSLCFLSGYADAEQVRLRSGEFLQGEVYGDQSNEDYLTLKLFSTGGVIRLRWDQLIVEDQKRLRDMLGLAGWEEEEEVLIDGHQIIFRNGGIEEGVAENPDVAGEPLKLRTASGVWSYPRDTVSKIISTLVPALSVYTPDQLYEFYLEEYAPESAATHSELAKQLVKVEAYRQAAEHFELALEDEDWATTEQGQMVRNLLAKVKVYVKADDALERVREVKRLVFQKKYEEALALIQTLRDEFQDAPSILKILNLDRLETQTANSRRKNYLKSVRRLFYRTMDDLVNRKIREKDPDDRTKTISLNGIKQWVANPRGLTQEIFAIIAEKEGLSEQEAMEFWKEREPSSAKTYNYGSGTFIHPEVAAKVSQMLRPKSARRTKGSSRRAPQRSNRKAPKMKSADEWWENASNKEKRNWARAWFAENGHGVLLVLRIETRVCRNCGGMGYKESMSTGSSEKIRTVCPVCNMAQHERIVKCR